MRLTSSTLRASVLVASLSLVGLAACGSDSAASTSTTTASTTTAVGTSTTAADAPASTNAAPVPASTVAGGGVVISVKVGTDDFATLKGTRVVSVPKGASVTLEFTDPNADQKYHLHGYDLEAEAKKGETAKISFTADQTGQFDVESHVSNATLLVVVVQ